MKNLSWKEYLAIGGGGGLLIGIPILLKTLADNCPKEAIPDCIKEFARALPKLKIGNLKNVINKNNDENIVLEED